MQCPTGKVRHETKAEAAKALRAMKALGVDLSRGLHRYKCPYCGYYHLGNRKPK